MQPWILQLHLFILLIETVYKKAIPRLGLIVRKLKTYIIWFRKFKKLLPTNIVKQLRNQYSIETSALQFLPLR